MTAADVTATAIAVAALTVSLVSFILNYRATDTAERRSRMPVLVFGRETETDGDTGEDRDVITVTNVGTGPAINAVMAQSSGHREPVALLEGVHETWSYPTHLTPIAPGKTLKLALEAYMNGMGVTYTDALGNGYTVKMSNLGTVLFEGFHLPYWPTSKLPFPAEAARRIEDGKRWGARGPGARRLDRWPPTLPESDEPMLVLDEESTTS